MTCAVLLWGVFPGFRAAYIESIRLTLKDMELVARPRSRAGRLGWEEVDGLETFAEVCTVRAGQKQLRFPIAPPFGLRRANVLMKTIISRAGLRFVDARFGTGATYKRFDAA
jgi:hypothetical protein